jgi:ribosome-associated protein
MTKRPKTTKPSNPAGRALAIEAARIAEDSHCEDIVVLNLAGKSPVTDFYVIVTGSSDRQMRSVAEDIRMWGKTHGSPVWKIAGEDSATWIVLDFVDVVVHLFDADHRQYYDLELLWGDASKIRWRRPKAKTTDSDTGADSDANPAEGD